MIEYSELISQRIQAILDATPDQGPECIKALAKEALELLTAPEAYGMAEELAMTEDQLKAKIARETELAWTVQRLKDELETMNPEARIDAIFFRAPDNSAECVHFVGIQDDPRWVTLLISQDPEDAMGRE